MIVFCAVPTLVNERNKTIHKWGRAWSELLFTSLSLCFFFVRKIKDISTRVCIIQLLVAMDFWVGTMDTNFFLILTSNFFFVREMRKLVVLKLFQNVNFSQLLFLCSSKHLIHLDRFGVIWIPNRLWFENPLHPNRSPPPPPPPPHTHTCHALLMCLYLWRYYLYTCFVFGILWCDDKYTLYYMIIN